MNKQAYLLLSALCLFAAACQKPLFNNDGPVSTKAKWEAIGFKSERLIQGLHATPFEWYAISENQYFRFDGDNELIEKRPLSMQNGVKGVPAMSDNAFVRVTINDASQQVVEFHQARNPTQVVKFVGDSLNTEGGFLDIEFLGRNVGVFSEDGTLFLLPAKALPDRHYVFFLFEIIQNPAHDEFVSIKVIKRIDIQDFAADFTRLKTMRALDGNFFVSSEVGAWRITPLGVVKRVFTHWVRDFFLYEGDLYATGLLSYDLHKSTDKGLIWERLNVNSELKIGETPNGKLLTNEVLGFPYLAATEDMLKAKEIEYPASAPADVSVYYGVAFFAGRYYFSMDRQVFFTENIVLK